VGNVLLVTFDRGGGLHLALGHLRADADALAADGVLFGSHFAGGLPARASLLTGLYLHDTAAAHAVDSRHATLGHEARKAGHAPALFGYTDTSADPRRHDPADPALAPDEGVLPGFDPELLLTESLEPWGAWLEAKGYPVPERLTDLYLPDPARARAGDPPTRAPMAGPVEDAIPFFLADRARAGLPVRRHRPGVLPLSFIRPTRLHRAGSSMRWSIRDRAGRDPRRQQRPRAASPGSLPTSPASGPATCRSPSRSRWPTWTRRRWRSCAPPTTGWSRWRTPPSAG
jgi:hypothetical protein